MEIVIGPQIDHEDRLLFHENLEDLKNDVDDLAKHGWKLVSEGPNKFWGTQTTRPKHRGLRTRPGRSRSGVNLGPKGLGPVAHVRYGDFRSLTTVLSRKQRENQENPVL